MKTESQRMLFKPAHAAGTWRMLAAMAVFALLASFIGTASAEGLAPLGVREAAVYGGFEAPCNKGEVLSGFYVDTDGFGLLGVGPECVLASNPTLKSSAALRWYGEDQATGEARELACPDIAPIMLSIRMRTELTTDSEINRFRISNLDTFCGVDATHPSREQAGGEFRGWGTQDNVRVGGGPQFCPAGQVAVGVHGSSSEDGLTEFGLICGPPTGYVPTLADRLIRTTAGNSRAFDASKSALGAVQIKQDVRSDSYRRLATPRALPGAIASGVSPANAPPADAPSANPPPAASPPLEEPPPEAPRMSADRGMPSESFTLPLFDDGAQLWACANAAQGSKKAGACNGIKAAKQYCRARGYSGVLQQHRDGSPAVTVAPARAGIPIRAANGDVCNAGTCAVVSKLDCAP